MSPCFSSFALHLSYFPSRFFFSVFIFFIETAYNRLLLLGKSNFNHSLGLFSSTKTPIIEPITQVACGTFHNLGVTLSGKLVSWGRGWLLGTEQQKDQLYPTLVLNFRQTVRTIACSNGHNLLITGKHLDYSTPLFSFYPLFSQLLFPSD